MGDTSINIRIPVLEVLATQYGDVFATESRPLSRAERRIAQSIYEQSINYDLVRIVITGVISGPITLGNNIRIINNSALNDETLIHEMMHIWQHQNRGNSYISNSAVAQTFGIISSGNRNAAYEYTIAPGQSIGYYSAEQQAMIVQHFFTNHELSTDPEYVRLIEEVRRARPLLTDMDRYQESLYGAGYQNPYQFRALPESNQRQDITIPILRVEF